MVARLMNLEIAVTDLCHLFHHVGFFGLHMDLCALDVEKFSNALNGVPHH